MCSIAADQPAPIAALDRIRQALDEAADAPLWGVSDEQLTGALVEHERLAARFTELGARAVREADGRGLAARAGAPSTAALLRGRLLLRPGEAKARVDLAYALERHLTATAAALAAGTLSAEHARVIARTLARLPADLDPQLRADAEATLLEQAGWLDPACLARAGKHLRNVLDPDAVEREEARARAGRALWISDRGDGSFGIRGELDAEGAGLVLSALDPLAAPAQASDGTPDPRTPARRRADALVELARRALDAATLPTSRGARPHLAITAGLDTLLALPGAPAADTTWGGPVTAATLRRIACDAGVSLLLTDQHGVPLHVGRQARTVTPGIWAALLARDVGCVFPGCTRPAAWCQAHHRTHWADGGDTSLDNTVLLCGFHHRVVHHGDWQIRLGADRRPELIPPPWIDADQKPRRNTYWDTRPPPRKAA